MKTAEQIIKAKIKKETQEAKDKGGKKVYFHFQSTDFSLKQWEEIDKIRSKFADKGWTGDRFVTSFNLCYRPLRKEL